MTTSFQPNAWQQNAFQIQANAADLAANAVAAASVSASLDTAIQLAAAVSAQASTSADLTTDILLVASASGVASTTAALDTAIQLAASVSGDAEVTADLTTFPATMSADAVAVASATGDLDTAIQLAADVAAQASVTASLTVAQTGKSHWNRYYDAGWSAPRKNPTKPQLETRFTRPVSANNGADNRKGIKAKDNVTVIYADQKKNEEVIKQGSTSLQIDHRRLVTVKDHRRRRQRDEPLTGVMAAALGRAGVSAANFPQANDDEEVMEIMQMIAGLL